MTLRRKTFILTTITMLALMVILYYTSQAIMLESYFHLERQNVEENLERVVNSLSEQLVGISSTTADWAYWDDSYFFVQDLNEDYLVNNLSNVSLAYLNINFMIFVDASDTIVHSKAIDLETEEDTALADSLIQHIEGNTLLLRRADLQAGTTGFIATEDGPVMIAARAILTSQGSGPSAGTLIMGRYLNQTQIKALSEALRTQINLYPLEDYPHPDAAAFSSTDAPWVNVQPLNANIVDGYTVIRDIYQQPALILDIQMPRRIYTQGLATLHYFLLSLLGIGVVITIFALLLVDRVVLARLAHLSDVVTRIRENANESIDIPIEGSDEISNLARGMREMLSALAQSRHRLQQAHDNLETLVEQRTAALVHTNTELEHEIAERKQAQAELAQARDQAIEALRLKTRILANISHDARTPLSVILMRAKMLKSGHYGPLTTTQDEKLESILLNVHQLTGFFDNLLDEAMMEVSQVRLNYEATAPAELLAPLADSARPLAQRKNLLLTWELAEGLPETVRTDRARFQQIMVNLVSNAIKFTREGAIHVCISPHGPEHWALAVSDTGPGIPPEAQEHIFDAFWQMDGSLTREANRGVGLGLSIVKQLTVLMDGRIEISSEIGKGTTFKVIFPLNTENKEVKKEFLENVGLCTGR